MSIGWLWSGPVDLYCSNCKYCRHYLFRFFRDNTLALLCPKMWEMGGRDCKSLLHGWTDQQGGTSPEMEFPGCDSTVSPDFLSFLNMIYLISFCSLKESWRVCLYFWGECFTLTTSWTRVLSWGRKEQGNTFMAQGETDTNCWRFSLFENQNFLWPVGKKPPVSGAHSHILPLNMLQDL